MKFRSLTRRRDLVVKLDSGDEVLGSLAELVESERITSATFHAIGVVDRATVGYLDAMSGAYIEHSIDEPTEVVALSGAIVAADGQPDIHVHAALAGSDFVVRGGHLLSAYVHPTLELFLTAYADTLHRQHDLATGQDLIDL